MVDIRDVASVLAVLISLLAMWRTRSSLTIFRDAHDCIIITNDSPHAVTIIEIGLIGPDGSIEECGWNFDDSTLKLPYRLDARDTVQFQPSIDTTIRRSFKAIKSGRDGTYVRMASGQLFGKKGQIFSDIGFLKRRWWWILNVLTSAKKSAE